MFGVALTGNIKEDPKFSRFGKHDTAKVLMTVAVNTHEPKVVKDETTGKWEPAPADIGTVWADFEVIGTLAETFQHFRKGDAVIVTAIPFQRQFENEDGEKRTRRGWKVLAGGPDFSRKLRPGLVLALAKASGVALPTQAAATPAAQDEAGSDIEAEWDQGVLDPAEEPAVDVSEVEQSSEAVSSEEAVA